ncbi:hypothetical protein [Terracoccus sp. 273MFTsu3.1]|uniref:hypothetical protein n=1 Tax=Terracoccus sp. 273MFTsu3.1 TaxID=1172188 RepID=UPI00037F76E3|nr:hypothetical protein [Terracoccus sp. 273MFTsu3.1]
MSNDLDVLHDYVVETIGSSPPEWPGGWATEVEAALIDAVFSVRARYGSRKRLTGVYGAVVRWRDSRGEPADDLRALAYFDETNLRTLTNSGKISGRYKAAIVIQAAQALVAVGVVHAEDVSTRLPEARAAYLSVKGCGPVTWSYFRMLLGIDDVKADTWLMRFVQDRLPHVHTTEHASRLVTGVADRMNVSATELDHAIWSYRRGQPA